MTYIRFDDEQFERLLEAISLLTEALKKHE